MAYDGSTVPVVLLDQPLLQPCDKGTGADVMTRSTGGSGFRQQCTACVRRAWGSKSKRGWAWSVAKLLFNIGVVVSLYLTASDAKHRISDLDAQLSAINANYQKTLTDLESLTRNFEELRLLASALNTTALDATREVTKVSVAIHEQNVTLSRVQVATQSLGQGIVALAGQGTRLNATVNDLQKVVLAANQAVREVTGDISSLNTSLSSATEVANNLNVSVSAFQGRFREVLEGTELKVDGQAYTYLLSIPYRCAVVYPLVAGSGSSRNVEYVNMAVTELDTSQCVTDSMPGYTGCFYRFKAKEEFCNVCGGSGYCGGSADTQYWVLYQVYIRKEGDVLCTRQVDAQAGSYTPVCSVINPRSFRVFALTQSVGFRQQVISMFKEISDS